PPLWVLNIWQCQLSSLLPVAGLLNHLDGLMGLRIQDVAGLALAGVERVLADARCLSTLTIHRCGLVHLPRLQSGSVEVLDLSDNAIENTSGLETLFRLKELNLAGNNVSVLTDMRSLVPLGAGCLRKLNLGGNPVRNTPSRYRDQVAAMLPSIQVLDGKAIVRTWRARMAAENSTVPGQNRTRSVYSTPPEAGCRHIDGYFSDGTTWAPRRAGRGRHS
ncbi:unnamed protein product, partial [Pylaiella littoralis]